MKHDGQEPKSNFGNSKKKIKAFVAIGILAALAIGVSLIMLTSSSPASKTPSGSVPIDSMGMMHLHTHLTLVIDGKDATVPAQIGIDSTLWNDHSLDSYGMTGMAPLHTHDTSGMIHVESYKVKDYYLGQLLAIWGLNLSDYKQVTLTVNGQPFPDYQNYVFKDGDKITLSFNTK